MYLLEKIKKNSKVLTLLLFLAFFVIRLYKLGYHDFWSDEVGTVNYAQYPWNNWNAPLYWIILHFWIKIFGMSEFSLRFPSLIFSFGTVILVYLLGKRLFGKQVGIVASVLVGLSPFHLWYAQEARDYSMALFFGTLSSFLLFRAIEEGRVRIWVCFIIAALLGAYTNYFCILLFMAQGIYLLIQRRIKLKSIGVLSFVVVMLGFSLYLNRFFNKFSYVKEGFWIFKPGWKALLITLENFSLGYNGSKALYLLSDLIISIFLVSAIWYFRKAELRPKIIFCVFLFILPIFAVFIFSRKFFSIYLDRGLIIFSPYYYILLALGVVALKKIKLGWVLLISLVIIVFIADIKYFKDEMFLPLEHHIGTYIKKPIRPLVKFINENIKDQDGIAFTNGAILAPLLFYSQDKSKVQSAYFFFDSAFPDTDWQRPVTEGGRNIPLAKIKDITTKRIWVFALDWARSGNIVENSASVKKWCDENLSLEFSQEIDGVWIFRYVQR